MSEQEVVALMESSKTEQEWNDNCDLVRSVTKKMSPEQRSGDYPSFWFQAIIRSGLAGRMAKKFEEK